MTSDLLRDFRHKKACQIAGQVMNVIRQFAPFANFQLRRMIDVVGVNENRRHADVGGDFEIMRHVFEHGGLRWGDTVQSDKAVEGGTLGLRDVVDGCNVADVFEEMQHADAAGNVFSVTAGAVGENQATAGQGLDRGDEFGQLRNNR